MFVLVPGFFSMKQQVFYSPLDGMLVHIRVTPLPTSIKFAGTQDWLIAAGAYPGFCSKKRLDGMPVHRRWLPHNLSGFPNNLPVPIYAPGWREVLWELSVLLKNTTQCPQEGSNLDYSIVVNNVKNSAQANRKNSPQTLTPFHQSLEHHT